MESELSLVHFGPFMRTVGHPDGDEAGEALCHYCLMPGKLFAASEPFILTTIAGSGVAICLWDSQRKIGGMAHFLLPEGPEDDFNPNRYANFAGAALLRLMLVLGANMADLKGKIIGGSLSASSAGGAAECLGKRNVRAAEQFFHERNISVADKEVGGACVRKVRFHTGDGSTWTEPL